MDTHRGQANRNADARRVTVLFLTVGALCITYLHVISSQPPIERSGLESFFTALEAAVGRSFRHEEPKFQVLTPDDAVLVANVTTRALAKLPTQLKKIGASLANLNFFEGREGINCTRKAQYESILQQFISFRDSLIQQNTSKSQRDAWIRKDRDDKRAAYLEAQAHLLDADQKAAAAKERSLQAVSELQNLDEQAKLLNDKVKADCDSTAARAAKLRERGALANRTRGALRAMRGAMARGHEEGYRAALADALQAVADMGLPEPEARILSSEVSSKVAPDQAAAGLLDQVVEDSETEAASVIKHCDAAREAVRAAGARRHAVQVVIVESNDEADEQRGAVMELQEKMHGLVGADMVATSAYDIEHPELLAACASLDRQISALDAVVLRLQDRIAACP